MKLKEYLGQFDGSEEIILIGPLFKGGSFCFEEPLIYVDGGRDRWNQRGFCVGDGDSLRNKKQLDEMLPEEKDFSDLEYVISQLPNYIKKIKAFGFLGKRKDHELSNLGSFFELAKRQKLEVALSEVMTLFSAGLYEWNFKGGFSILPYEKGLMKISGDCKYSFEGEVSSPFSSQFISNEADGLFRVESMTPFSLYRY